MALAHGYALPFVTQKVVGDYASDNAAAAARAIASGATKEAAGSCLDARAIDLQMRVPQRTDTNLLTNSAMSGATGSVLPTKWVSGSVNGLTVTISSAFTSAGFQAIDWTVSGTADSDGTIYIGCEPNDNTNAIPASIGQQYIGAMSLGKQAGTIPATMVMQVLGQKSSDGSVIETANSSTDLNGLVSSSLTRINTAVLSIASVSSDRVNFRLTADVAALDVISFTIRIAAPQVERNDRISPYITTTTGAASRVTGQPSLLIVPQLTKSGVVYPQLPTVSGADFTFTRATTATRVNASGLIESVASGLLRLDYPIGGGCPAALIEPSGSNGIRNNSMVGANVSTNALPTNWLTTLNGLSRQIIAIGTESGIDYIDIKLSGTANNTVATIAPESSTQIVAASGQTWTNSVYIKIISQPSPPSSYSLAFREGTSGGSFVNSGSSAITPTTTLQRLSATRTLTGATTERVQPQINFALVSGSTYDFTVRIGWPQMEQSSVATSPIPTTTGSASRNADQIVASGALVSGLIGQTEGTVYVEVDLRNLNTGVFRRILAISDGTTSNVFQIFTSDSSSIVNLASTASGFTTLSSPTTIIGVAKIAFAYALNDVAFYINGNLIGTRTPSTIPACNTISLGSRVDSSNFLNDRIRAAAIYTTRLSNDQLANLTRLT